MLCVGTPPAVRIGLERRLQEEPALVLSEPFAMVRVLLDEVIKLYDEHTWRITKLVRAVEKVNSSSWPPPPPPLFPASPPYH